MPYPPQLEALKGRVEATRSERLSQSFPRLTMEEKQALISSNPVYSP